MRGTYGDAAGVVCVVCGVCAMREARAVAVCVCVVHAQTLSTGLATASLMCSQLANHMCDTDVHTEVLDIRC